MQPTGARCMCELAGLRPVCAIGCAEVPPLKSAIAGSGDASGAIFRNDGARFPGCHAGVQFARTPVLVGADGRWPPPGDTHVLSQTGSTLTRCDLQMQQQLQAGMVANWGEHNLAALMAAQGIAASQAAAVAAAAAAAAASTSSSASSAGAAAAGTAAPSFSSEGTPVVPAAPDAPAAAASQAATQPVGIYSAQMAAVSAAAAAMSKVQAQTMAQAALPASPPVAPAAAPLAAATPASGAGGGRNGAVAAGGAAGKEFALGEKTLEGLVNMIGEIQQRATVDAAKEEK